MMNVGRSFFVCTFLLFFFSHQALGGVWVSSVICKGLFHDEVTWDPTEELCDYKGKTWSNTWGMYGSSFSGCIMALPQSLGENDTLVQNVIFKSMGKCGCPSNCSETFRGTCINDKCQCAEGYAGDDCISVSCDLGQSCSEKGFCQETVTPGWDVCACDEGFSGVDCSANMGHPPPIQQTLDIPQYTSWDLYGDDNPIFDQDSVAVINIEMDPADLKWFMEPINTQTHEYKPVNMVLYFFSSN